MALLVVDLTFKAILMTRHGALAIVLVPIYSVHMYILDNHSSPSAQIGKYRRNEYYFASSLKCTARKFLTEEQRNKTEFLVKYRELEREEG